MNDHIIYHLKEKSEGFVDLAKQYVFKVQYWATLVVIFLVGIFTADVFSIAYLSGAFVFLWFGTDFYLKPLPEIIRTWDILLMCNVFILVTKALYKVLFCNMGEIKESAPSELCWVLWLCEYCDNLNATLPFLTDGIAFVFIIMQRRIFCSYYFYNIINETYAISVLSSRFVSTNKTDDCNNVYMSEFSEALIWWNS